MNRSLVRDFETSYDSLQSRCPSRSHTRSGTGAYPHDATTTHTQNTKLLPVLYEVLSSSVSLSVCYTITQIAINESLPDLHDQWQLNTVWQRMLHSCAHMATVGVKGLTAVHFENWRRSLGRSCTTWMKTIQQDLKSNNLSLNEAIDMAQNHPLWRLMSIVVLDRKEEEK